MNNNFNQGFAGQGFNQGFGTLPNQGNQNSQGFAQQGFNQGFTNQSQGFGGQQVSPQVIQRIHQNSVFQGASQLDSPEIQRIHNASLFQGHSQFEGQQGFGNPLSVAGTSMMNQGFGGQTTAFAGAGSLPNGGNQQSQGFAQQGFTNQAQGFNQGFGGQQVSPQVIERIHQNSVFQGASQFDSPEIQRIHQASLFQGGSQPEGQQGFGNPLSVGFTGATNAMNQGFAQTTGFAGTGTLPNGGNQQSQGFAQQGFNQGFNQGFTNQAQGFNQGFGGQQVSQQVIDRIHQNSLFQGGSQPDPNANIQRIHQASLFQGGSQPEGQQSFGNPLNVAFTGGTSMMNQGFGQTTAAFAGQGTLPNAGNQGQSQGFNQAFNQGFTNNAGFGGQQVSQQAVNRIHQNSIFNGASQFDNAQVARIQQNTISGNTVNPLSTGFGGGFQQNFTNQGGTFRAVMNADAGIRDNEGPSAYPASMYTGSNQYDTVNQAVFNQMVGRQF